MYIYFFEIIAFTCASLKLTVKTIDQMIQTDIIDMMTDELPGMSKNPVTIQSSLDLFFYS